jgi:hypothetical protein
MLYRIFTEGKRRIQGKRIGSRKAAAGASG